MSFEFTVTGEDQAAITDAMEIELTRLGGDQPMGDADLEMIRAVAGHHLTLVDQQPGYSLRMNVTGARAQMVIDGAAQCTGANIAVAVGQFMPPA